MSSYVAYPEEQLSHVDQGESATPSLDQEKIDELVHLLAERIDAVTLRNDFASKAKRGGKFVAMGTAAFVAGFFISNVLVGILVDPRCWYEIIGGVGQTALTHGVLFAMVATSAVVASAELGDALPVLGEKKLMELWSFYWGVMMASIIVSGFIGSRLENVYCLEHDKVHKRPGVKTAFALMARVLRILGPSATMVLMLWIIKMRLSLAKKQTPEALAKLHQAALNVYEEINTCYTIEQYHILKAKIAELALQSVEGVIEHLPASSHLLNGKKSLHHKRKL